jgi:hypothetical protein
MLALNYTHGAKLRLRTSGSTGKIPRTQATKLEEGDGYYWGSSKKDGKNDVRLPVKYRYRSPTVFEFHISDKRKLTPMSSGYTVSSTMKKPTSTSPFGRPALPHASPRTIP